MSKRVKIIDYGAGNILSNVRAFEHCDADVSVVTAGTDVGDADFLVLPGVGAFVDGMNGLTQGGFVEVIHEHIAKQRPFLGICLGMQMLLEESYEFGTWEGLGCINGKVDAIPKVNPNGVPHKIPHVGWSELRPDESNGNDDAWQNTILRGTKPGSAFYFVHSFVAAPTDKKNSLAVCQYNGLELCAAVHSDNVFGTQFHPEKSGELGLNIIKEFLSL